ncbi:MAG TPA: acetate--CoA ligase family protein [Streptosporangiaceae bacterium]|nr:acetate--CoA ligase family protein [Streptosporangiaceae bacterium]
MAVDDPPRALPALFTPRSVAVVGASGNAASPFARPLRNLIRHGFDGEVVPVNPKYAEIDGLRCVPSLRDVPVDVDLVIVLTPAAHVIETIEQAAEVGAGAAVVCSSGFAETGATGRHLQAALAAAGTRTGLRILGPNSQGLVFGPGRLAATFTAGLAGELAPRGAAYVGQSGAIGGCVLDNAREYGLPVAAWVSTGNQADVDAIEVAGLLLSHERIDSVMCYLETTPHGPAYVELAERARQAGKPLVVLRSGRSDAGRRANVSHTGATIGPTLAFELASARHGVILADDPHEMLLGAQSARAHRAPRGGRIGIVTTSGGAGAVAADHCERAGLRVPAFSAGLRAGIAADIPAFGAAANPVDLTAQVLSDASRVSRICATVAGSAEVDAVLFIATMVTGEDAKALAGDLAATIAATDKPIVTVWLAGDLNTGDIRRVFGDAGLPVFRRVPDAIGVLRRLHDAASAPGAPPDGTSTARIVLPVCRGAKPQGPPETIVEGESLALFDALGIGRPRGALARTPDEADQAARELADDGGGRVVLKLQSPAIPHKSDVGAVRPNVPLGEVRAVFRELMEIGERLAPGAVRGVLVQAVAPPGPEFLIGVVGSADGFPPVLSLGVGGTETDLHDERVHTLLPLDRQEALRLIGRLRAARLLLAGFRGRPAVDADALAEMIVKVGELCGAIGDRLLELEINPVRVYPEGGGALALDFLLRRRPEPAAPPTLRSTP